MTAKPVRLTPKARQDISRIARHYRAAAGEPIALAFAEAVDRALRHISDHPASGSPRYAHWLELPGLRVWPLRRFPHLVFYVEQAEAVDVWRVLHGSQDMPEQFAP